MLKYLSRLLFGVKVPSKIDKLAAKYEIVKARNRVLEAENIKKDKTILHLAKKCLDLELKSSKNVAE